MKFIIIYITFPNRKEAKQIVESLIDKKLVACANYFPIESVYWWKDEITNAKEIVSIVKTRKSNWAEVKKAVEAMHPYETPCIMKLEVESNTAYADWIHNETKKL
ncbi:MAG: divalent-cation tolerance protein CutA [Candidatus Moraniibacteriota bacterium]